MGDSLAHYSLTPTFEEIAVRRRFLEYDRFPL
jgi:hypothetical protein